MNRSRNNRRALLATFLMGSMVLTATGCTNSSGSRFASMNPFSKPKPTLSQPKPGVTESIAQGTKTMWKRSGEAVSGMFAGDKTTDKEGDSKSDVDPLRLDHKSELSPEVLVANGRLWESTGNLQKAMENYTMALEHEPDYSDALTNIARLHFRQENHTQAADFFGRAIKQNPKDAGLYNDLGLTLSKLGNHAAAEQTLARALELAPGTSRYANNLASVKFESGDKAGALKVLQANNKPAVASFNMAYLHYKSGEMQDAQTHLTQVMQSAPQSGEDASVKQAVDRSRELLAQLAGPQATIAQAPPARPQATVPASGIRQTSQSSASDAAPAVTPAAGPTATPSAAMIKPSVGVEQVTTPKSSIPPATKVPGPQTEVKATPKTDVTVAPGAEAAPEAKAAPEPEAAPKAQASRSPAEPFALPPSFFK